MKKQWKRLLALLMVLTLCVAVLPGAALAAEDEESGDDTTATETSKTLTVGADQTYTTVQQAINAIYAEEDPTGWTIEIKSGSYLQFAIPKELDGLTVKAADGATVTITTWTGDYDSALTATYNSTASSNSYYNTQGYRYVFNSVYVQAEAVTFSGLNFTLGTYMPTEGQYWYRACITDLGGYANGNTMSTGMTVTNCTFSSNEQGYVTTYPTGSTYNAYGILIGASTSWTVKQCSFDKFSSAICFMCDNYTVSSNGITVSDNTFTSCDRAMDGYYGGTPDSTAGVLTFTYNSVTGTSALRSKVVVMDQASKGSIGGVVIMNNTFSYTMVLLENMAESSCTINEICDYTEHTHTEDCYNDEGTLTCEYTEHTHILDDNTFSNGSYYVEGDGWYYNDSYNGTITINLPDAAYYESPSTDTGYWVLNIDLDELTNNSEGATAYVQSVIDEANASGSHTLSFTWLDTNETDLLWTVTAFKDAIYWVSGTEKTSEPGMDKVIIEDDGTETDSTTAAAGDVIDFELRSTLPESMKDFIQEAASAPMVLADEDTSTTSYDMTFHDVMDSELILDEDSFKVTIIKYKIEDGNIVYETTTDEDGNTVSTPVVADTVDVSAAYYTVTTTGLEDDCTFEVTVNLLGLYQASLITSDDLGSAAIVVSYSATLSEDAEAGTYENTAWVEWPDGESEKDTVTVDTYGINIFKYDQSDTDDEGNYVGLAGATFELQRVVDTTDGTVDEATDDDGNTTYTYTYTVTDEEGNETEKTTTVYQAENKVETEDEDGNTSTETVTYYYDVSYTLTSGSDGYVTIEGLDAGTYYLVETEAPSGYVCSSTALEIVLPTNAVAETYIASVQFANAPIPSTGGTGTAMYTTVGVIILLAAGCVFLFSHKKRESN